MATASVLQFFCQTSQAAIPALEKPSVVRPHVGSIAGDLAKFAIGAHQALQGGVQVDSGIELPGERGGPLVDFLPHYHSGAGLSEWGMGWQTRLSIQRFRTQGSVDFVTDQLSTPWGEVAQGDDGFWYPVGLKTFARLQQLPEGGWLAATADGKQWMFGQHVRVRHGEQTYAWLLEEVTSLSDGKTSLFYETNASGRPYLARVTYGGHRHQDPQYETVFRYEDVQPLVDYRPRTPTVLDRRVSGIQMRVLHPDSHQYVERWSYQLTYHEDPAGPAYYLAGVQKHYADGSSQAKTGYSYRMGADTLRSASLVADPTVQQLQQLLRQDGLSLHAETYVALDAQSRGQIDIELAADWSVLQLENGVWQRHYRPASAVSRHRSAPQPGPFWLPRYLVHMRPEDREPVVVVPREDCQATAAGFALYSRDNVQLQQTPCYPQSQWAVSATVKWADLSNDGKPSLFKAIPGGYEVLRNASTASSYAFFHQRVTGLLPELDVEEAWLHDLNGDGILDYAVRSEEGLWVWYGDGAGHFVHQAVLFAYRLQNDQPFPISPQYQFYFFDANNDGLADVLLLQDSEVILLVNTGAALREIDVPALRALDGSSGAVLIENFSGSADTELHFPQATGLATLRLTEPGCGLLQSIDDHRGVLVNFAYARADAQPGLRYRLPVLRTVVRDVAGEGTSTQHYAFAEAKFHDAYKSLLGFAKIELRTPQGASLYRFVHDATSVGDLHEQRSTAWVAPHLQHFAVSRYDQATYRGIEFRRLASETHGLLDTSSNSTSAYEIAYKAYAETFCPSWIEKYADGLLLRTRHQIADISVLRGLPHCQVAQEDVSGHHNDASLDFFYTKVLQRNEIGQITSIVDRGTNGATKTAQTATYDAWHRLVGLHTPGQGSTNASYAAATGLLTSVTSSDGVETLVATRHPTTDQPLLIRQLRGTSIYDQHFSFGPQERLSATWNNVDGSSSSRPTSSYNYREATAFTPAAIHTQQLVDAQRNTTRNSWQLQSAGGQLLTTLLRTDSGYASSPILQYDIQNATQHWRRATEPFADPNDVTFARLLALSERISTQTASEDGLWVEASHAIRPGVTRRQSADAQVRDGALVHTERTNGRVQKKTWTDAFGNRTKVEDALGHAIDATHDAAGRLRHLYLADGSQHTIAYDHFGRLQKTSHSQAGSIAYAYADDTDLCVSKRWNGSDGVLGRSQTFAYDPIGRAIETRWQAPGQSDKTFHYLYDGAHADGERIRGQLGFVTGISGPGYSKRQTYRADGTQISSALTFDHWLSVSREFTHRVDGSLAATQTKVVDPAGQQQHLQVLQNRLDDFGRTAETVSNDRPIYKQTYDRLGRLADVSAADGHTVHFGYDPTTGVRGSVRWEKGDWRGSHAWQLDEDGHLADETFVAGEVRQTRNYAYDGRGALTTVRKEGDLQHYAYSAIGLPLPTVSAQYDLFGRVKHVDGAEITYGADGRFERVVQRGHTTSFLYDETGQRLAHVRDGRIQAAYLADGTLSAAGLHAPVAVDGQAIGFLHNSAFSPALLDERGTFMADPGGAFRWPQPFGPSDEATAHAALNAFAGSAGEPDLSWIRMGQRDYDPRTHLFTSPDPALLANPALCLDDPAQCNLYSYARNNPLAYSDPEGEWAHIVLGAGIGGAIGFSAEFLTQSIKGEHDTRALVAATIGGMADGGLSAALGGASLIGRLGVSAVTSVAGGSIERAINGQSTSAGDVLMDATVGVAIVGITHGLIGPPPGTKSPGKGSISTQGPRSMVPSSWQRIAPNDGFYKGEKFKSSLLPGATLDRFGLSAKSTYLSPVGTSFASRGLPLERAAQTVHTYRVVKSFEVWTGLAEPISAFGSPGMGRQYLLDVPIRVLESGGFLEKLH